MIKPNLNLLLAIRAQGMRQRDLCRKLKFNETHFSEVIAGKRVLDLEQQQRISDALNVSVADLFPNSHKLPGQQIRIVQFVSCGRSPAINKGVKMNYLISKKADVIIPLALTVAGALLTFAVAVRELIRLIGG